MCVPYFFAPSFSFSPSIAGRKKKQKCASDSVPRTGKVFVRNCMPIRCVCMEKKSYLRNRVLCNCAAEKRKRENHAKLESSKRNRWTYGKSAILRGAFITRQDKVKEDTHKKKSVRNVGQESISLFLTPLRKKVSRYFSFLLLPRKVFCASGVIAPHDGNEFLAQEKGGKKPQSSFPH